MARDHMQKNSGSKKGRSAWVIGLLSLCAVVIVGGAVYYLTRPPGDIETVYGYRAAMDGRSSVNGTAVFAEMFEQAGHRVFSRGTLSPKLKQRAECIAWFPDRFEPPSADTCRWLEEWLQEQPERTLIYVGRDFDAAIYYWEHIKPNVPKNQRVEIQRRLSEAKKEFDSDRVAAGPAATVPPLDSEWFTFESKPKHRKVRSLESSEAWCDGIDAAKLEIELHGRMKPGDDATVLLESQGDMLVSRQAVGESRLFVVANGSFLLNLPLVNHEHRRLAGKFVEQIGPAPQTVVFLESSWRDPPIVSSDGTSGGSSAEIFCIWPTNWILIQLAAVGIIFCFWKVPVFGPTRRRQQQSLSDFGRHIDAVGELLELSGDEVFAHERLQQYSQTTRSKEH